MQGTFTVQDKIRVRGNVVLYYIMSFNFDNGKEQCLERSVLLIFKLNKRVDWCLLLSVQLWNISTLCLSKMNSKKPPRGKIVRECRCMMISITQREDTQKQTDGVFTSSLTAERRLILCRQREARSSLTGSTLIPERPVTQSDMCHTVIATSDVFYKK